MAHENVNPEEERREEAKRENESAQEPQGGEDQGNRAESQAVEQEEIPLEEMDQPQLVEKVKELQETAGKNYDLYMRSQAEIENLKKRFQRDKQELAKFSNESLVKQLLPVIDSLEKAIAHAENDDSLDALKQGVELTLKSLKETLEKAGLEEVKAVGEQFDPNYHEAMGAQELPDHAPGAVVQEFQKGYLLNNRLIRPAMVMVNKKREQSQEQGGE